MEIAIIVTGKLYFLREKAVWLNDVCVTLMCWSSPRLNQIDCKYGTNYSLYTMCSD